MKNRLKILSIIAAAIVLVTACCTIFILLKPETSPESHETQGNASMPLTPSRMYAKAVENMVENFTVNVSCTNSLHTEQILTQTAETSANFYHYGTDDTRITANTVVKIGQHTINIDSAFKNSTGYLRVADSAFCGEMTVQKYCSQFAPVPFFETKLYKVISSQTDIDSTIVTFSEPSAGESWSMPDGAVLIAAQGTATLTNGELTQSTYEISYKLGSVVHKKQYLFTFAVSDGNLLMPDEKVFTVVLAPEASFLLEQAYGYLMMTPTVSANMTDSILCETFGDELTRTVVLNAAGDAENYSASLSISMQQKNTSRGGEVTQKKQSVVYENGVYMMVIDDGEPTSKTTITPGYMQSYCQDYLVGTVLMPKEVSDIRLEETDIAYTYHFESLSEALASRIRQRASQDLYGENGLLENLYTTDSLGGYLTIDKSTGLPIASGISYSGTHLFDGNPYQLVFKTDQTYNFINE